MNRFMCHLLIVYYFITFAGYSWKHKSMYMFYQAIATKVIKYSSVANKRAQSLSICGIKIHEVTFTLFIQMEAGLK